MPKSFNSRDFKKCLGSFASGVTVVTTLNDEKKPTGITVSSFASVSLSPPLVLFSLNKEASLYPCFMKAPFFGVNILNGQQRAISQHYAFSESQPWEFISYQLSEHNVPHITESIGFLECERHFMYDGGDHTIIVGKVLDVQSKADKKPLLYFRGEYFELGQSITGE
jgi:flavin reductase (DIM6/NTAB) family NADH-FMN oxidoreductase RutF